VSVRLCALERARGFLGVTEEPPGSNRGHWVDQWNTIAGDPLGSAWCMAFVHSMYHACGKELGGHGSVGFFRDWAQANGELVARPYRGDLACFEWEGDSWPDHVGFCERVLALPWFGGRGRYIIRTLEGNAGDAVRRLVRVIPRSGPGSAQFVRIPG
jgi:hypothetical protein